MLTKDKYSDNTFLQKEGGLTMETACTNDYYLHFNETYFLSKRDSRNEDTKPDVESVKYTNIRCIGHKLFKGVLKTIGDVSVVLLLLAICKYSGIYDLWIHVTQNLF